jgi:hypothetical protein
LHNIAIPDALGVASSFIFLPQADIFHSKYPMKPLFLLFVLALGLPVCSQTQVQATKAKDDRQSPAAPGCGVGRDGAEIYDQSLCGNHNLVNASNGPYEDLRTASPSSAPSSHAHKLTRCTTIVPTAEDVWRFQGDIDDGVGGTNQACIYFGGQNSNNFVIDLAGHTLIGGISCDQRLGGNDCSGITVVNGTINCNIANGGAAGCIAMRLANSPSKSILLSHLTVNNSNSPAHPDGAYSGFEFGIYLQADGRNPSRCSPGASQKNFNGACLEVTHTTVTIASGYDGTGYTRPWCARCTDIFFTGNGGVTAEVWNSTLNNGAFVDAEQGIVFFHVGRSSAHHNYFPWRPYLGRADTGRQILFDCAGKGFCETGGNASNNLHEVYNHRAIRTRQVNKVVVTDSRFEHVQSPTVAPAIMMGGNGDYAEKIDGNRVSHNTFTQAGGTSIEAAESYGLVADSNTFLCDANCSAGILAASWVAEGANGLTFPVKSASRTPDCLVTLNLAVSPSTTSMLAHLVFVNVSDRADDFNVSGTAGNRLDSISGSTVTYMQSGCSGANTGGPGGTFWMAQSKADNFAANGAELYIKNSKIDPLLTMATPFVACGTTGPPCQNPPQTTMNGGQTQMHYCNNRQRDVLVVASGGTGTLVAARKPDSACP